MLLHDVRQTAGLSHRSDVPVLGWNWSRRRTRTIRIDGGRTFSRRSYVAVLKVDPHNRGDAGNLN